MGSWVSITKHPEMVGLKPILTLNRLGGGGGAFDKLLKMEIISVTKFVAALFFKIC